MPVEFGRTSLVPYMDPDHFATGMVAPSRTNAKCTALPPIERKESCFHVISLLSSCDLAVCVCQSSLARTVLFDTWYHIPLLLKVLLQVHPLSIAPVTKNESAVVFPRNSQAFLPSCDLAVCKCQSRRQSTVFSTHVKPQTFHIDCFAPSTTTGFSTTNQR